MWLLIPFKVPKWAHDAQGTFFGDVLGACGLGLAAAAWRVLARGFCCFCCEINYAISPSPVFGIISFIVFVAFLALGWGGGSSGLPGWPKPSYLIV